MFPAHRARKASKMAKFEAEYIPGGRYNFCSGYWTITRDGEDISDFIPDKLISSPMNTLVTRTVNIYIKGHGEEYVTRESGLSAENWIAENHYWTEKICQSKDEELELFQAFQKKDWRYGCCGGCV